MANVLVTSGKPSESRGFQEARGGATRERVQQTMERAVENLARLQGEDGAWPGDYGGPMFLLPMYLVLCHVAGRVPEGERRAQMIAYFSSVQRDDGSVGLHAQDIHPSLFCTTLTYVSLRVLGLPPDDPRVARMRTFIHEHGSPLGAASWGKLTLCVAGLYEWEGIHPVLPELWLLPYSAPFHPGRLWCHCRQVYLPMAWLYGSRARSPGTDALTKALREELYQGRYDRIDWPAQRDTLAACDAYRAPSLTLNVANRAMGAFEKRVPAQLRKRALAALREHIAYEDDVTSFVDIGPVNKVLDTFVEYFEDPAGERFERAFAACEEYLWQGHDGMKMQGYNSSKLWDTAFAAQAVVASKIQSDVSERVLARAYDYVRDNQILEDVPERERYFRDASKGGWPFSNRTHGWPITDCTAEGFKVALALESRMTDTIPEPLLRDAVILMLDWQNDDGGWATYERQRGGAWIEALNPSQVFGDIMVDYSYVECSSACMQALAKARGRFGGELDARIERSIQRGERFLRKVQREDGSFEGSWAVCFTYGTWFGIRGLRAAGAKPHDPAIVRACEFLLRIQRDDGGWGEHGDSCRERRYVPSEEPGMVQTAWALSALVSAESRAHAAMEKAAELLVRRQEASGAWKREAMVGVFNKTCLIDYDNYRHYFPLWALAEWSASASSR